MIDKLIDLLGYVMFAFAFVAIINPDGLIWVILHIWSLF